MLGPDQVWEPVTLIGIHSPILPIHGSLSGSTKALASGYQIFTGGPCTTWGSFLHTVV